MTYLKDSSESKTSSSLKISKHVVNASKGCLILLMALCLTLAILTILKANPRMKTTSISNIHTFQQLESKMVEISEFQYVPNSCGIKNCTVNCRNAKKIYEEIFQVLQGADCEENIVLVLNNQHFPNYILTNRWKPVQKAISSVVITNSDFTHIRNEAFNSIDFTKTQMLTLMGVKLKTLGNGVLLGFANLRSLHLEGKVQFVDRCFFQPVQASLLRLTLRVELIISGRENIFGISFMSHMGALDLSDNFIRGSLSKSFFSALPRLKYLTLSNSEISSIDMDAFDDIANSLSVLDLSNNMLVTLDVGPFEQVLAAGNIKIYLLGNEWLCDCKLKHLISLYENYEDNFGDVPYCRAPLSFYGVLLTNVTFDEDCNAKSELEGALIATPIHYLKTESLIATSSSTEKSIAPKDVSFKMACLSVISLEDTQEVPASSDPVEYFLFAPPCHDFELFLLENNSVQVIVQNADEPINIIWFSEAVENFVLTVNGITIDYNCEVYSDPFLIAENLEENCTYTFCLVPSGTFSITPFNCLPLHVPSKSKMEPSIWISKEEKELTVGIVCLIFICSLLLGGVVAYFGIKAYPDILEGSNHVLVVKKSNKAACYVSTITEGEYMIHKNSLKKKASVDVLISQLSATISSSPPNSEEIIQESLHEDYYEMPCIYDKSHNCQQKCMTNKCVTTPSSPPPLPKRNSDSTLYGSPSEFISNVPFPNRSL